MAVDSKALKNHPGANPEYAEGMRLRLEAMQHNQALKSAAVSLGKDPRRIKFASVPKQPNKYVPHIGAKQRARGRTNTGE